MPYIIQGEPASWKSTHYPETYSYDYPEGLDLKPDSDFHIELRNRIWHRARESRNAISKRFDAWREMDRVLTVYLPLNEEERLLKKQDPDKPTSIVYPYSYSIMDSVLTYLTLAFFQDPIFQYEGVESSDTVGAMLLEMVVSLHCHKTKVPLYLHTTMRDSLSYGIGIAIPGWVRRYGKKATTVTEAVSSPMGSTTNKKVVFQDSLLFEGNSLDNIDPYMWLPDPSVSSIDVQKGEFVGWVDRTNFMTLLSDEAETQSPYFNVKYLRHRKDKKSVFALDQSQRTAHSGGLDQQHREVSSSTHPVDVIKMFVTLIPKDWKLGPGEIPEKWYFELAADDVIIRCERANYHHGMYPITVTSPEFDGYSIAPLGRLELVHGLQHILDFLLNSHNVNVRKALNDMFVVDPFLVNMKDLEDPKPGKLIRLRKPGWGRGVDKVVQQLQVQDVTRANIADSAYITQMMDKVFAADQSMQGALRMTGPERLTGMEFQGTRGAAMNRLQRIASVMGIQLFQDIGTLFAVHTQQFMQEDAFARVTGRYAEELQATIGSHHRISPADIAVNYDILVRDGSIPGGNFSNVWIELFKIISGQPELMMQFDVTRIFMYIAKQLGAKNVEDFKRMPGIAPIQMDNEEVMRQADAGNIVPMEA